MRLDASKLQHLGYIHQGIARLRRQLDILIRQEDPKLAQGFLQVVVTHHGAERGGSRRVQLGRHAGMGADGELRGLRGDSPSILCEAHGGTRPACPTLARLSAALAGCGSSERNQDEHWINKTVEVRALLGAYQLEYLVARIPYHDCMMRHGSVLVLFNL